MGAAAEAGVASASQRANLLRHRTPEQTRSILLMKPRHPIVFALLAVAVAARLVAAINPEEYKRIASDVLKLREVARVVETRKDRPAVQRITIVAEVIEVARTSSQLGENRL